MKISKKTIACIIGILMLASAIAGAICVLSIRKKTKKAIAEVTEQSEEA